MAVKDDIEYKRVTVKIKGAGVHLRDLELGKNIGTKRQFLVKSGQFIISRIDARNGAMGIIPRYLDGAIVTNDFPLFDVDTNIVNPDYLRLITTTEEFIKVAHSSSSGTTNRQRADIDNLLQHKIPLPSLGEQEKLVADYNKKIEEAEKLLLEGDDLKNEIKDYINVVLGFEKVKKYENNRKSLNFVEFQNLQRWDLEFLINGIKKRGSKFPLTQFKNLFLSVRNGIPERNYTSKGIRFLKVSDIKNNSLSNEDVKYVDSGLYSPLQKNTLLITRKGTVGNSYFLKNDSCVASSEIFIIKIDESKVDGDFIAEINQSDFFQSQYKERNTGTIMPSLSQEQLLEISIPLPPIDLQRKIVFEILQLKEKLIEKKKSAINLKQQARQVLEKAIFN